jgi:hypothetical protein
MSEMIHPVTVCHIPEDARWTSEPAFGVGGEENPLCLRNFYADYPGVVND